MLYAWIEGKYFIYKGKYVDMEEKYWTYSNKSLLSRLPLLKYHARKNNDRYIKECKSKYLMLDYI